MTCTTCHDVHWTCEHHPDLPVNHDDQCSGAAAPCPDCRSAEGQPPLPDGWISIDAIEREVSEAPHQARRKDPE
ncbi:MAG TPA: hypothetical protein VGH34_00700 [Vicinamibacterales bacterium]|jgi:hypothetical protein